MIQKRHIAPLLAGLMLLAACNKEQEPVLADTDGVPAGHLKLSVESPRPANGSKPLLDGLYTYWKNLDRVYVNGVESRVRVASSETYIENYIQAPAEGESYIAGTFPFFTDQNGTANTNYSIPSSGKNLFFDCPASYNYSVTSDGKVDLGNIPMVAVAGRTASELTFKHLTATINVKITNGINSTFRVTSVEVSSSGSYAQQICGRKLVKINPDGELTMNGNTVGTVNSNMKKVTVNFPSNTDIAYNETLNVPVPVTQVNSGRQLTIKVTGTYPYGQPVFTVGSAYSSPGAGSTATYTRNVTLTNGLARNSYVNANVQLKPSESYFSSNVLNNWVKFCYNNSWLYGNQMCLWSTYTNEDRAGSFELTAAHLTKIMQPELSSSTASAAGSLLVWHQGEDRFKLLIFPHGTTLGQFPTAVRPNVNFAGYTIKDYANNGGMRGIPCVNNGTYEFLGNGSYVDYISLDLNAQGISNYVTLDVVPLGPMGFSDSEMGYDPQSHTQYSRIRTHTRKYECKYKNMTVTVEEKKVEVYPCDPETGVIYGVDPPISTHREVSFLTTRQDNLNPSSRALYGLRVHN